MPQKWKPRIFVGSSLEALEYARAVRSHLHGDADVTVWNEDTFKPSLTSVESIEQWRQFDLAILIATPDDETISRGAKTGSPRDNVVFELGFFVGAIGRERTFLLKQDDPLKLPSDLYGVTHLKFRAEPGNEPKAVAEACDQIRRSMGRYGTHSVKISDHCKVRVRLGQIQDHELNAERVVALPCNEYFDQKCANDPRSALGTYVKAHFADKLQAFIAALQQQCQKCLGPGERQQRTPSESGISYGAGKAVLLEDPVGQAGFLALLSTATERETRGLESKAAYVFDCLRELVLLVSETRVDSVVVPLLGAGHGRTKSTVALSNMLAALKEALDCPAGKRIKVVDLVVFSRPGAPEVEPRQIEHALSLFAS